MEELLQLAERFVLSWEKIAESIAGLNDTYQRQVAKEFPERVGQTRDAVVSRVPTAEDRIREEQGASGKPIAEWLSEPLSEGQEEDEDLGTRERDWVEKHKSTAGSKGIS